LISTPIQKKEVCMPRYFFTVQDDDHIVTDDEGMEFADLKQARDGAVETLPQIASDTLPNGDEHLFAVHVADDRNRPIVTVTLTLTTQWHTPM
jgi:hypothetical protein